MSAVDRLAELLAGGPPGERPQETWVTTATVTAVAGGSATVTLAGGVTSVTLPFIGAPPAVGGIVFVVAYGPTRVIVGQFGGSGLVGSQHVRNVGATAANGATSYASFFPSVSYTKRLAGSSLVIAGTLSGYATNAAGLSIVGFQVNGTDVDAGQFFYNDLSAHRTIGFRTAPIAGVAAGTVTIQPRARAQVLNSPIFNTDSNDQIEFEVRELVP